MAGIPIPEAARVLGIRPGTLARWVKQGAPCVQRGRRGRGHALLVDVEQVLQWRGAAAADALVLELATALPEVLAGAAAEAHRLTDGPCKTAAAGVLAGCWYLSATAVLDLLRQRCPSVGEVRSLPEEIERLQKIGKNV